METATEKIIRLLLVYPKKQFKQVELARNVGCSKVFVSKIIKKFTEEGILSRISKNEFRLISFSKLINNWISLRKLPNPEYIKTELSMEQILKQLKKMDSYALTLLSGAWERIKFMKTNSLEIYTTNKSAFKKFGKFSKEPTNFMLFKCNPDIFTCSEKINDLTVVSIPQNYVDLMVYGGSGIRVAIKLAEKYNLLGV